MMEDNENCPNCGKSVADGEECANCAVQEDMGSGESEGTSEDANEEATM